MVVFAGQGDAARSMELLWRSRDPESKGLTVDTIVEAAIAVADTRGMAALSMRAVGERLGRTAMALYTYVPNKSELVDLMYDRTLTELPATPDTGVGWRAAVTAWAEELWEFYLRHPWVLQVSQARPVLGPGEFGMLDGIAGLLHTTGLPARSLRPVVSAIVHFVRGSAQAMAEARQAAAETGMSDDTWWFARSAVLEEVAPDFGVRFPMLTWLETEDPDEPDDSTPYMEHQIRTAFVAGLAVLLDGVEAAVTRKVSG